MIFKIFNRVTDHKLYGGNIFKFLACKALMSGCSHTVITFERLDRASRLRLRAAAELGQTQSLNIRLGN